MPVFADLHAAGLPLGDTVQRALQEDGNEQAWAVSFRGCELRLERALDFWPLVGDVASQEQGGSRLVDASTARWQVLLRPAALPSEFDFAGWRLTCAGVEVPLRRVRSTSGEVRLFGLRLREFQPWVGLHPAVASGMPLRFTLSHPDLAEAAQITLHGWQPEGLPYAGLPRDLDEARQRRAERLVVHTSAATALPDATPAPAEALTAYSLDLRWLSVS